MLIVKIKTFFLRNHYRFQGLKIGKKTEIGRAYTLTGYLNKIIIGNKCCLDKRSTFIVNKEGSLKIGDNTLISTNININSVVANISIGSNVIIAANSYIKKF